MKVFVIGGAGYVGSHCVRRLVEAGHTVTVYDNLSAGHAQAVPSGVELIRADLGDEASLAAGLDGGYDAVMHFAAWLDVGESVREPLKYYENNVSKTIQLLRLMRQREIRKIVFSSTCAVYGTPPSLPMPCWPKPPGPLNWTAARTASSGPSTPSR